MTTIELETNIDTSEVEGSVNKFRDLKKALSEAKSELLGLEEGTDAFVKKSKEVGEIKNRIDGLNSSVKALSGAPVENLTGSFSLLTDKVRSLNFRDANTAAKQFAATAKSISFKEISAQAKEFAATAASLGKSLLLNPLFIVPAAIAAIIAALVALKDKIPFVSRAFEAFEGTVKSLTEALKTFTDFLGVSAFAAEEAAEKQIKASKKATLAVEERYNFEIQKARAAGKETIEIEREKVREALKAAELEGKALVESFALKGRFNDEEKKRLDELVALKKKLNNELTLSEIEFDKKESDRKKEELRKQEAEAKKFYEQRLSDEKRLHKQISDERNAAFLASIKDEEIRANSAANIRFAERNKDIEESKAGAKVKAEALKASELQLHTDLNAIKQQFDAKRKADEDRKAAEEKARNEKIAQENRALEIRAVDELIARENSRHELELAQIENNNLLKLEKQRLFLEEKRQLELYHAEQVGADIDSINIRYATAEVELNRQISEEKKRLAEENAQVRVQIEDTAFSAFRGLSEAYFIGYLNRVKGNTQAELEARKRQFAVDKAFSIARATIDGYRAVSAALTIPPPEGPILAGVQAVLAAANIARIAATKFEAPAGSAPSSAGSSPQVSSPASPRQTGSVGVGQLDQMTPKGQQTNQPSRVYVLESDIRQVAGRVKVIEDRATFSL